MNQMAYNNCHSIGKHSKILHLLLQTSENSKAFAIS